MKISAATGKAERIEADLLALGLPEGTKTLKGAAAELDKAMGGAISDVLASGEDFSGKPGQKAIIRPARGIAARIRTRAPTPAHPLIERPPASPRSASRIPSDRTPTAAASAPPRDWVAISALVHRSVPARKIARGIFDLDCFPCTITPASARGRIPARSAAR